MKMMEIPRGTQQDTGSLHNQVLSGYYPHLTEEDMGTERSQGSGRQVRLPPANPPTAVAGSAPTEPPKCIGTAGSQ